MARVYMLTNESFPQYVKVGFTERSVHQRASELHTTGVPTPFEVRAYWVVSGRRAQDVEKDVHRLLKEYRVKGNREFFQVDASEAVDRISQFLEEPPRTKDDREDVQAEKAARVRMERGYREEHEIAKGCCKQFEQEWKDGLVEPQIALIGGERLRIAEAECHRAWHETFRAMDEATPPARTPSLVESIVHFLDTATGRNPITPAQSRDYHLRTSASSVPAVSDAREVLARLRIGFLHEYLVTYFAKSGLALHPVPNSAKLESEYLVLTVCCKTTQFEQGKAEVLYRWPWDSAWFSFKPRYPEAIRAPERRSSSPTARMRRLRRQLGQLR